MLMENDALHLGPRLIRAVKNKSLSRVSLVLLLFILGFAGNYFKLSLFYGFDFLFGSIFLMIILNYFGIGYAVIATIIASSLTYMYWNHPYGIITFSMEMLVVGIMYRKYKKDLILLDCLFWLFIGSPLNFLLYYGIMKVSFLPVMFVILKQSVNGIFNVLIASIIIDYLPINIWFHLPGSRRNVSIRQALFHILLAAILIPTLAIMVITSRKSFNDIESGIGHKLKNVNLEATSVINSLVKRHMDVVVQLADTVSGSPLVPSAELQNNVKFAKGFFPDFQSMYIGNASGVTVSFYPELNDNGDSTTGLDFSDRAYFKELKKSLRPVMSDVFLGRVKASVPIVTLNAPILKNGRFIGYASGAFDLSRIEKEMERVADDWGINAVILDRQGKVIVTTKEAYRPMQVLNLAEEGEIQPLHSGIYNWLPPIRASKSAFDRWKNSFYILESPIGKDAPWKLLLEAPVAPYQKQLYETTYVNNFAILLAIIVGSIFFSSFLSRRLVYPIERLKTVTTGLPSKIASRKTIEWPNTNILEIHSLIGNFMDMTSSLMQKFTELKTANDHLEQRVATRTVELTQVNDKLCVEIDERVIAEERLFESKEHLEENVRQRTADLLAVNGALQKEIGKHRHTEECLASEKEMLSVTLQGIGDGVISTDIEGNVVLMNKVAEELTGWAQQEMAGRPLPEIFRTIGATNPRKGSNPLQGVSASGVGGVVTDNALLRSRNGAEYSVSSSYAPIMAKDGNIIGGVSVFRDNTERRKIEEKLLNAQKLESIGVLAGGIAHDFNNLFSAIIGNISMAREKRDYSSFERLEEIEEACRRAAGLTQQLLTFSKGGSPVRKTTPIVDLIRQSAIFVTRGSNVRCEFHFAGDLWPVYADEGQLNQVINNLVINARQAMPDGGIVRISAENVPAGATSDGAVSAGNSVKVSVRDAGPGIPPEDVSKIFDPYFTTKEHGSGLGLATIYSIVTRHGGKIDVETRVGLGTTFHVYLPVSDKLLEDAVPSAAITSDGKGKILVMDDEESIRHVAGEMLAYLGHEATCAKDGAEAIELYKMSVSRGEPFDVVIMDLTVPGGMGGKEAMGILKRIDPGIVAIVSSGYSNDPVMAEPGKFGFSGVVAKPYTINTLSNAVHGVMDAAGVRFENRFALVSNGY